MKKQKPSTVHRPQIYISCPFIPQHFSPPYFGGQVSLWPEAGGIKQWMDSDTPHVLKPERDHTRNPKIQLWRIREVFRLKWRNSVKPEEAKRMNDSSRKLSETKHKPSLVSESYRVSDQNNKTGCLQIKKLKFLFKNTWISTWLFVHMIEGPENGLDG